MLAVFLNDKILGPFELGAPVQVGNQIDIITAFSRG
jgi:hypothetical protein